MKEVIVVGAGLAGCEAAYQLAKRNIKVILYEKKLININDIQQLNTFAELVCSNTFRSTSILNAVGILKKELELLDSFILECAYKTRIPSDDALAVDRVEFSKLVDYRIRNHKNITVIDQEYKIIDENKVTLIAVGPLCSEEFKQQINKVIGNQKLFYLDASAPIIEKNSIDFNKVYFKSRHNNLNDNSYICIPLDEQQFNNFYNKLINAKKVELKEFEKQIFFRGCQPIEQLASISKKILLKGPLSSNNLENPKTNVKPHAVVQLRRDDALDNLYNMVGFQTNLAWNEQKELFTTLPGLEKAVFRRFGVMHKNNYINSPKILNKKLQVMRRKNIFFTGQITGVEGYIESFATGIVAAFGIISYLENKKFSPIPKQIILGSLIDYITNEKLKKLKPMKANMGLIQLNNYEFKTKNEKNLYIYKNSIKNIKKYLDNNKY